MPIFNPTNNTGGGGGGATGTELLGDGGLIRIDGNGDNFGPNTIYIEGANQGDSQVLFREGLYMGAYVGADGSGTWEPALQFNLNGAQLGSASALENMGTTIHGGGNGITLNPGGEHSPVAINGRGHLVSLSPAGDELPIAASGHMGTQYYFNHYLYTCVDTDTWVRTKVDMTINGEFVQPALDHVRLKSPDGNAWRLTVDNAGVISTTIEAVV